MFYVRNGCGIRRLTLRGLTGTLVGPNIHGTSRPNRWSICKFGSWAQVADTSVWIASKAKAYYTPSTYI